MSGTRVEVQTRLRIGKAPQHRKGNGGQEGSASERPGCPICLDCDATGTHRDRAEQSDDQADRSEQPFRVSRASRGGRRSGSGKAGTDSGHDTEGEKRQK